MTIPCMQCGARFAGTSTTSRCPSCRGPARDSAPGMFPRSSLAVASSARGEGSGLIDLRAMRAGLGAPLSIGGPTLGSLAPVSSAPPPRPTTRSHTTLPASQLPLYSLVVALMLGLATLSAHVLTRASVPPPPVRVELPALVAATPDVEQPEPTSVKPVKLVEPVVEPVVVQPVLVAETRKPAPGRRPAKLVPEHKPTPAVAATEKPVTAPTPVTPDDSVDCLLGRKDCGRPRSETAASPEPAAPALGGELPAMLEQSDISALTSAGRSAASDACGSLVRGGERVKLRLSIAGPSGSITSTAVVDDAGNPQLAACAAQEVARLPVKKVQKPQIGAMLTLKF